MSLSADQVGRYLQTIDPDTVLDIISGELDEGALEHFFYMLSEHSRNSDEYNKSCRLFATRILNSVVEYMQKDLDANAMFSPEVPDKSNADILNDSNKQRAIAFNDVLKIGYAQ